MYDTVLPRGWRAAQSHAFLAAKDFALNRWFMTAAELPLGLVSFGGIYWIRGPDRPRANGSVHQRAKHSAREPDTDIRRLIGLDF